jgi:putative transposase
MLHGGQRGRAPTGKRKEGEQLALAHVSNKVVPRPKWGGRRAGAGRKRAHGTRRSVPHRVRAPHAGRHPVHVTLRLGRGLPSLREERVREMLRSLLFGQRKRKYGPAFHVVELSIQDTHLHLMVEAVGEGAHDSLRSGISGCAISFAKRLNMMLGRKGKVWGDRWHGRELTSPSEVRNILGYIFRNIVKHGARVYGSGFADWFSSAPRFTGWSRPVVRLDQGERWPTAPPRTWLLGKGWRLVGLLDPDKLSRPFPKDDKPQAS